jgi:hypothetical protein
MYIVFILFEVSDILPLATRHQKDKTYTEKGVINIMSSTRGKKIQCEPFLSFYSEYDHQI